MLSILDTTGKVLDEKATIRNVREFFNRELPIIKARAHQAYIDIKSPVWDDIPKSTNVDNGAERKLTNHMQAKQWLTEIVEAINAIPEKLRQFIDYRYMKYKQWIEIEELSGYSRKRGQQLLNEAFLYFADGFTDTYDFRVWH
ncbi:ArpU family phage packaging/lysis transcriptional regulator [Weissella sagaensis]|uniref:ArpU family phage packaging/lysis transcriptional regulator n=1 Tax=Weissella sagaensis TaxID=2559928 RepID=A0ABW1RT67_9LACO|nr:ArpU family phage packaging/lysis transcriptional regulator [Weissella sagaensis]